MGQFYDSRTEFPENLSLFPGSQWHYGHFVCLLSTAEWRGLRRLVRGANSRIDFILDKEDGEAKM
jgi:hypothetical protein